MLYRIVVLRAEGALETIHFFIKVSRTRFANKTPGLKPRPCRDETQKIFPREGAEKTGAQRQRQGRGGCPNWVPLLSRLRQAGSQVPAVGRGGGGRCTGLHQGFGWSATVMGEE